MSSEVGKKYYFVIHAYYHIVAELAEVTGKREGRLTNCKQVINSNLSWSRFFEAGLTNQTVYHAVPDINTGWICNYEWNHPIPKGSNETKR